MNLISFESPKLSYLDQIDDINSDFVVLSSKNDIPSSMKPPKNFLSLKILDFSSHLKLLQKQKSIDKITSENHLKTIEELKFQENSNFSNHSLENSNIFTLGGPNEDYNADTAVELDIKSENIDLKSKLEDSLIIIQALTQENSMQKALMLKIKEETIKINEYLALKEKEYNVLKLKYETLKNQQKTKIKGFDRQNEKDNDILKESNNFSNFHFFQNCLTANNNIISPTTNKIVPNTNINPTNIKIKELKTLNEETDLISTYRNNGNILITTQEINKNLKNNEENNYEEKKYENTMKKGQIKTRCDYFNKNKEILQKNDK